MCLSLSLFEQLIILVMNLVYSDASLLTLLTTSIASTQTILFSEMFKIFEIQFFSVNKNL